MEETLDPLVGAYKLPSKESRLEAFIKKIAADIDYTDSFNRCVIDHLKFLLIDNKTVAVKYMKECFDTLRRARFSSLTCKKIWCKTQPFEKLICNKPIQQEKHSYITTQSYQKIYDFSLSKSITSNDSANSTKNISKLTYLRQVKKIRDPDVQEKEKYSKNKTQKVICTASKKIYTESIRKLHDQYNGTASDKISLSVFYSLKPFYCMPPGEKEK